MSIPYNLAYQIASTVFFFDFSHHTKPPSPGWLNDNRESIVKKLGTNTATLVAKEAGAQWKKLSAAKKKPYEAAARRSGRHFLPSEKNHKKWLVVTGTRFYFFP